MTPTLQVVYPIAETFFSIQGEGLYAGTPMYFVRFAGCNVGRVAKDSPKILVPGGNDTDALKLLNDHTICTSFAGEEFWCDTNYRMTEKLTSRQIATRLAESGARHVCLTGGEPLLQPLLPLCREIFPYVEQIHIETSGTLKIDPEVGKNCWITCAPKKGYLDANWQYIDEWKFVCGPNFDWDQLPEAIKLGPLVYICPINNVNTIDEDSRRRALDIVMRHPHLRLGQQMHKHLGVR